MLFSMSLYRSTLDEVCIIHQFLVLWNNLWNGIIFICSRLWFNIMCHLFVFMGCYFPVGIFKDEGQASFRNHNKFKGIIWSIYQWTWTWVWVNSGSWWWTERPGVLRSMGLQRAGHDWVTELSWTEVYISVLSLLQTVRYTTDGQPMDIRMVFILWHVHRLGEIWMALDSVTGCCSSI